MSFFFKYVHCLSIIINNIFSSLYVYWFNKVFKRRAKVKSLKIANKKENELKNGGKKVKETKVVHRNFRKRSRRAEIRVIRLILIIFGVE